MKSRVLITFIENVVHHIYFVLKYWWWFNKNPLDHHEKNQEEVDWLEIPDHILSLVTIKLNYIKDYIRFGAVCQSWHSVYVENRYHHHFFHKPPLLMLATELNHDNQTRSFYSLAEKRVIEFRVPVPHDRLCRGSTYGWLVMVSKDWDITLLNPFSSLNNVIQLPSATTFQRHHNGNSASQNTKRGYLGFVVKVILSANPTSNPDYVVMAIYSDFLRLAFFKPGDNVWTSIDPEYAAGELLQVCRDTNHSSDDDPDWDDDVPQEYYNAGFDVFKLDRVAVKWIKMDTLHGHVLFLGDNSSYSLSALDFKECKPNSIYFTDDYYEGYFAKEKIGQGPHDIGVFDLEHGTHEPHYPTNSKNIIPAPIWIEPM
ncbi:hypothetical protein AQUCO_00700627v1 [Aquilegia coerulea]|uniref:KIB1-4 beta-propeller domain-containing protein n=1 Tax=Aquilegia coerulea TaxID=218851 RepID=A0A2G5ELI6_AQUCA|nr:hypothetical protein AQUCO_00700627v1 [Aquilegia coerulea]